MRRRLMVHAIAWGRFSLLLVEARRQFDERIQAKDFRP